MDDAVELAKLHMMRCKAASELHLTLARLDSELTMYEDSWDKDCLLMLRTYGIIVHDRVHDLENLRAVERELF